MVKDIDQQSLFASFLQFTYNRQLSNPTGSRKILLQSQEKAVLDKIFLNVTVNC